MYMHCIEISYLLHSSYMIVTYWVEGTNVFMREQVIHAIGGFNHRI
jgi:hypothetical protein